MNNMAGFAFTSYSHTALPVPVFAQGREAYRFDGKYENTEVAVRIAEAMRAAHMLTD
jgi:alkaline phosphatase